MMSDPKHTDGEVPLVFSHDDEAMAEDALEREALERFEKLGHSEDYRAVVFVDLLGFSDLTLRWPVIEDEFRVLDRPNKEDFLRVRLETVVKRPGFIGGQLM